MIHCRIVTPEGIYKEFDTPIVNIETEDGQRGVLPNHMPLVTMLKIGALSCDEDGERKIYALSGGLFSFRDNVAEVFTDSIESQDEIDVERAIAAKERAEKRLKMNEDPNIDQRRAQAALLRALNRLNVKNM